jgi:hypothetical protein
MVKVRVVFALERNGLSNEINRVFQVKIFFIRATSRFLGRHI